jgi:hypothetical protein
MFRQTRASTCRSTRRHAPPGHERAAAAVGTAARSAVLRRRDCTSVNPRATTRILSTAKRPATARPPKRRAFGARAERELGIPNHASAVRASAIAGAARYCAECATGGAAVQHAGYVATCRATLRHVALCCNRTCPPRRPASVNARPTLVLADPARSISGFSCHAEPRLAETPSGVGSIHRPPHPPQHTYPTY